MLPLNPRALLEDGLIIICANAGLRYRKSTQILSELFTEWPNTTDGLNRLKKRIQTLRENLGPGIIGPGA